MTHQTEQRGPTDIVRRLAQGGEPPELEALEVDELRALRRRIDDELLARRLPLLVDEIDGRPLIDELEARTGDRGSASRLLTFMETWGDEAVLSDRGEPTVAEVASVMGVSKPTADRRLRQYPDIFGTEDTPTALIRRLRNGWLGALERIPVRGRETGRA